MNWSFSPGLVAAFSEANCSGTGQCAQSSTTPMPDQFYWPDKPTEHSRLFRFGMTCEPLTGDRGEALLTWFREDSRARTSASQERVSDWTVSAAGYGEKWPASLARFDPDSRSWRTAQHSLLGDSDEFSVTWPRSGMTVAGRCWEQPRLGRRTKGTDSGFLPTPTASTAGTNGKRKDPESGRWINGKPSLTTMATQNKWPTPTVCGNYNRKGASATSGDGLATAVRMWPTPQSSDNRNRGNADTPAIARRIEAGKQVMLTMTVSGGQLSADWTEWLMGWPIGHTALKPSGTAKCRSVTQQHGDCLQEADA